MDVEAEDMVLDVLDDLGGGPASVVGRMHDVADGLEDEGAGAARGVEDFQGVDGSDEAVDFF